MRKRYVQRYIIKHGPLNGYFSWIEVIPPWHPNLGDDRREMQRQERPHATDFPQKVVNRKGNPRKFQGNHRLVNYYNLARMVGGVVCFVVAGVASVLSWIPDG